MRSELIEVIDPEKLMTVAELSPITWVQRLGYLLESVGSEEIWLALAGNVNIKNPLFPTSAIPHN